MNVAESEREREFRARYQRILAAMAARRVDVLLLSRYANAHYASGARRVRVVGGGGGMPWVVVFADAPAPAVYTTDLDGVPEWIGGGRLMRWDPAHLVAEIRSRAPRRIAYDVLSPRLLDMLQAALPGVEWDDADALLKTGSDNFSIVPEKLSDPVLRRAKVDRAMARAGLDGMVLLKPANVRYAAGAQVPGAIVAAGRAPLLLTGDDAELIAESLSGARRIAIDRWNAPLHATLRRVLPHVEWIDADGILADERMIKLPAEVELLRRAQQLNERAIGAVLEALRPGVREIDLTAVFDAALERVGVTEVLVESVWCALPKTRGEAPWTPAGALPYRELTSERVLRDGDLVAMDTGILHEGYMSDFGRTWRCGTSRPSDGERRIFDEWCEIRDRLFDACRPGNSALTLRRAALAGWRRPQPPWPLPLYVAHSIGLGGVEPPFVGTDLGEAVEDRWALRPGMVLVFEPYVWEEGVGGYRAEETVVVTEAGCERFTQFPYGAFAA